MKVTIIAVIFTILIMSSVNVFADRMDAYCQTRTGFELFVCDSLNTQDERITALESEISLLKNSTMTIPLNSTNDVPVEVIVKPVEICDTKIINGQCVGEFILMTDIMKSQFSFVVTGEISEPNNVTVMVKDYKNDLAYVNQVTTDKYFKFDINMYTWDYGIYYIKITSNGESMTETVYYGNK